MAQFKYVARSKSGERLTGTIAASSHAAANVKVQQMGLFPVTIDLASDSNSTAEKPGTTSTLFPEKVQRWDYFIRWLLFLFAPGVVAAMLLPLAKPLGVSPLLAVVPVLLVFLLRIPCADIPRLRSIGWSPWLLLLLPVPIAGFVVQLLLFFVPAKNDA